MRKKRRIFRASSRLIKQLNKLSDKYYSKEIKTSTIISVIDLTIEDRITHIYKVTIEGTILEVVNVSYEIKIDDQWISIIRYDSSHGFLHRHILLNLVTKQEIVNRTGVISHGGPGKWYTWAIKDLQKRYLDYRVNFTRKNKIANLGY